MTAPTPIVDFVVSARNNRSIISATLDAISRQTIPGFTCTLVDGRSTDGTPEFVRERYPWVRVVVKGADTGPAHSRNLGARAGSAEFVVFVDSDVVLDAEWAAAQVAFLGGDARAGIAGGRLLYSGQPDLLYAAYGAMSRYGIAWDGGRAQPAAEFTASKNCLWINSSAMVMRRTLFEQCGGFDEAMFLGCEDSDLGWRANLLGWRVMFNPAAVAMHEVHGTLDPATMSRHVLYLIWRNRLRSALVNYEGLSLLRYISVFVLLSAADALAHAPRREKLSALWWNVRKLRDTLARRRDIQRRRTVRDRDLWPLFQYGFRGPGYGFYPRGANAIAHAEAA